MNGIYDFMKELNKKAAEELIKVYRNEKLIKTYNDKPSIVPIKFPKYYNGKSKGQTRVSEQELRFAMACLFDTVKGENKDYSFSIETPTENNYSFSKNKEGLDSDNKKQRKRSAQTDMTLYEKGKSKINIEFKANNQNSSFDKDIEKLLRENNIGAWCHILRNADDRTWKSLLGKSGKFKNAFNKVIKKYKIKQKPLYFSFLVLEKGTFYWKEYNKGNKDFFLNIESEQDMVNNNSWEKWEFSETSQELERVPNN